MKQKRRTRECGYPINPSFQVLPVQGHTLGSVSSSVSTFNPNNPFKIPPPHRATRREGKGENRPGPLIPFLSIPRSFLNHLNLHLIFNLIQQRGTTHRGPPSLLHLHAKGDPHRCTLIKKLPLRSAFSSSPEHRQLNPQSFTSIGRFIILFCTSFSPLRRRITLNWF